MHFDEQPTATNHNIRSFAYASIFFMFTVFANNAYDFQIMVKAIGKVARKMCNNIICEWSKERRVAYLAIIIKKDTHISKQFLAMATFNNHAKDYIVSKYCLN